MSMISEQVRKLREYSEIYAVNTEFILNFPMLGQLLNQAADTIETLSAKLQAANMENSGGWIACNTGDMPDIGSAVLIQFRSDMDGITGDEDGTFDISYLRARDNSEWFCSTGKYPLKAIKAWKSIKAYRP